MSGSLCVRLNKVDALCFEQLSIDIFLELLDFSDKTPNLFIELIQTYSEYSPSNASHSPRKLGSFLPFYRWLLQNSWHAELPAFGRSICDSQFGAVFDKGGPQYRTDFDKWDPEVEWFLRGVAGSNWNQTAAGPVAEAGRGEGG